MKKLIIALAALLVICMPLNALGEEALIVYFSCTGNTQAAAEALSELIGADVFRIEPETPYSSNDLNYNDANSRANLEIKDASSRPKISNAIDGFEHYSLVYVGYPIWWGDLPPIMRTFFESYDFSGKTVMPFCTSGSSGISKSVATIREFIPAAEVKDGLRAQANGGEAQFEAWIPKPNRMFIHVGDSVLTATLSDNSSAEALVSLLREAPITIEMQDYANFEKVGELGQTLPRNDENLTTAPGDLILYLGSRFVIYYDSNTWEFTKLGKIDDITQHELKAILGGGDVTVTLSLSR